MMARVAVRLGVTEGHAYTLCLGLLFAVALLAVGIPPVLREVESPRAAPLVAPPASNTGFDTRPPPTTSPVPPSVAGAVPTPTSTPTTTPTAAATPTTTATTRPKPGIGGPLAVALGRWTSAPETASTGHASVPEDGLPVGALLGRDDTRTYVLLRGGGTRLTLALSAEPGAQQFPEVASVRACPITESPWSVTDGEPHDTGPAYDSEQCVEGAAGADGHWTFDLSRFSIEQRTGSAGFALVPTENSMRFQVVFEQ